MRQDDSAMKLILIVATVLVLAACGGGEPGAVELTAADSGTTVTLEAGQQVEISLESNASTGFQWNLAGEPDAAVLELVSSTYVEPETSDDVVGAPGTEIWTFEAVGTGTTSVELAYFRPFEPETVGGTFSLTVDVS
jgi:inhibitor of cysteine peptidase